jgi:hypothetical protein
MRVPLFLAAVETRLVAIAAWAQTPFGSQSFRIAKHYRNQEEHNCRCSDHSADDSSAEDSTSYSAWTGTMSLRGEQTLLLRGVRNLQVPDETEFNATLRFTMP